MKKMLACAALGLAVSSLAAGGASAQNQMRQRQPTAQTVPQDDTVLGTNPPAEGRSSANASKAATNASRSKNAINRDVGFPDICANCNE